MLGAEGVFTAVIGRLSFTVCGNRAVEQAILLSGVLFRGVFRGYLARAAQAFSAT